MGFKVRRVRIRGWLSKDEGEKGATLRPLRPRRHKSLTGRAYYASQGDRAGENLKISETMAKRLGLRRAGSVPVTIEISRKGEE